MRRNSAGGFGVLRALIMWLILLESYGFNLDQLGPARANAILHVIRDRESASES
jgi:hypothetical protein